MWWSARVTLWTCFGRILQMFNTTTFTYVNLTDSLIQSDSQVRNTASNLGANNNSSSQKRVEKRKWRKSVVCSSGRLERQCLQLQKNDVNLLTSDHRVTALLCDDTEKKCWVRKCRWKLGQHGRTLKNSGIYKELTNSFWVLFMDIDTAHCLKVPLSASSADLDHHSELIHMSSKVLWRILVFSGLCWTLHHAELQGEAFIF